ncbi:MAG: hypothetical protein IJB57_09430 [Clostridia bacterium]|nr:hypothetical protein [Clostridia bacterium]
MFCSNCGNPIDPTTGVCANCNAQPAVNPQPVRTEITEKDLPEKFQPLGAWSYFWLNILFGVPVVGFIFLLIFTFNDGNRNRRNFARSQWCMLIVVGIVSIIVAAIAIAAGVSFAEITRSSASYM